MCSKLFNGNYLCNNSSNGQSNTRDLKGILHAGNRLYMKIPKTHGYLLVMDKGHIVTEYRQRYSIEICRDMFGTFTEGVDTVIGIKLSDALKSVTKENEWTYEILCIWHLAAASACAFIIQKDDYYISDLHSRNTYGRPIDGGNSILLYFNSHEECCTWDNLACLI